MKNPEIMIPAKRRFTRALAGGNHPAWPIPHILVDRQSEYINGRELQMQGNILAPASGGVADAMRRLRQHGECGQ